MKLPKCCTTVTPLSKTLALMLFILLPFIGFYFGYRYKESITIPEIIEISKEKVTADTIQAPVRNLLEICGDIPTSLFVKGHFTQVKEPVWSPDCRYIVWSAWESGVMGVPNNDPLVHEGIFLYSDKIGKSKRIYKPVTNETVEFQGWKDSTSITFTKNGQGGTYALDVISGIVSKQQSSKITPDLTLDDASQLPSTTIVSKNNIIPENNSIYFGKYENLEAIFITSSEFNGEVRFSDSKKNHMGDFKLLENPKKILSGSVYSGGGENFLLDSSKENIYLTLIYENKKVEFDNFVNKIFKINLSDLSVKEVWSNTLGSLKYTCGVCGRNIRGGATLSQVIDKYLVFDLFSGFESDGMFAGTIILNINSKAEKYHEMIADVRINLNESSYSFQKLMSQKETCEYKNDYGCDENGQRDVYKPVGEIFTNALP